MHEAEQSKVDINHENNFKSMLRNRTLSMHPCTLKLSPKKATRQTVTHQVASKTVTEAQALWDPPKTKPVSSADK